MERLEGEENRMARMLKGRDNDVWIRNHFEMIVKKYGGKYPYILVASGKVFPVKRGQNIAKMEEDIRRKYGPPTGMPVPKPEDFNAILSRITFHG